MATNPGKSSGNLEVDVLAYALTSLGRHAAQMESDEALHHDDCTWCETMKLFSRVADFGGRLRAAEKRGR